MSHAPIGREAALVAKARDGDLGTTPGSGTPGSALRRGSDRNKYFTSLATDPGRDLKLKARGKGHSK